MLIDFEDNRTPLHFESDIAVIGAGAVGLSLVAELTRQGHKVLLLEAGGAGLESKSQAIFTNARSTGFPLEGLHSGRYRLLGGTTNFWGGQLVPFSQTVFQKREWLGCKAWPFDLGTLASYYERAMSLLGLDGAIMEDAAVWRRAKTEPPDFGDQLELFFTRWTPISNLARHFHKDIKGENATVLLHANVVGFSKRHCMSGSQHIAHIATMNGRRGTVTAKRFVLACGTFEISRLLMIPYVDGTATPWNDNPWLGRGYIDHVDLVVGNVTPINLTAFNDLFENIFFDGFKYNPKLKLADDAQRHNHLLQAVGEFVYRTSYAKNAENIKIFIKSIKDGRWPNNILQVSAHIFALRKVVWPLIFRYLRHSRMFHPSDSSIILRITSEQIPLRESCIRLREQRDVLGMPMIDVNWAIDGVELETIARCAEMIRDALVRTKMAEIDLDPRVIARDPTVLKEAGDTNHQMGGARIGSNELDGVVDSDLKVFGADDVYVAGAAVMPSSGFANCTLTAIALAIRLSDHLRKLK